VIPWKNHNANRVRHVLVLNYEFPPLGGGASPVSYEIAKGYVASGFSVDVVTMAFGDLPRYEKRDGLTIYRVASGRRKKSVSTFWEQLAYLFSAFFTVRRLLSKKQYAFCHCHFLVPTGILALVIHRLYGLKFIVTSHGSDVPGHNIDRFINLPVRLYDK
jgi:glycosyltransferase involved in cell wall biosynthesis